ncbi:MAG: type IX secretion system outer membrane channel protein PorV [Crocinitomicaceae bacterium]|nr:type IX secretion system outer membrane channel protein PorV [Crocinitomicaceae bacterium]
MNKLIISAVFGVVSMSAFGQATDDDLQLNTITTAVPFMAITPDSRAGAMGDAGTALGASSTSLYWNTSMINFSEEKGEISVSYTPWLRQLTNDIHLSYLSGYYNINERHAVGAALRYFSLGEITFTDESGNVIRDDKPSEFEITLGYAFKTSPKTSVGLNGKFVYSNLTGGLIVAGTQTVPGIAGAADISFTYFDDDVKIGKIKAEYTFATTINNIGNKIKYTNVGTDSPGDFLPMSLRFGNAMKFKIDKYNDVTLSLDIQKLLVPTPPKRDENGVIVAGKDPDVGVISGMLQSFYDAPGTLATDDNGNAIQLEDGSYEIVKNSRFLEELTEINFGAGIEYWYNDLLAIRGGYFHEARTKGARQYFNLGAGFKYNMFGIDISYLAALKRNNPLANTLRFTLRLTFGDKKPAGVSEE